MTQLVDPGTPTHQSANRFPASLAFDGAFLVFCGIATVVFAKARADLALVPSVVFVVTQGLKWLGACRYSPASLPGWVYAAVLIVTPLAPSMGGFGAIARMGLAVLASIALANALPHRDVKFPRLASAAFSMLVLALACSLLASPSTAYGLTRFANWLMFAPAMFLYFYRPDARALGFGMVASAALQSVGVALQWAGLLGGTWGGLITSGGSYNPDTSTWLRRYTGFVGNPNDLALLLALSIIVLVAFVMSRPGLRPTILAIGLSAIFAVGIVWSGSRGGIVALALGLLVVLTSRGAAAIIASIILICTFGAVAIFVESESLSRVLGSMIQIVGGEDASTNQRLDLWAERIDQAESEEIWLGAGFGGYDPSLYVNQRGLDVDEESARMATIDNSWLKLFLESGVLGVVAMVMLLGAAVRSALSRRAGGQRFVAVVATASLLAMLSRSFSVDMLHINPWNPVLFLVAGACLRATVSDPVDTFPLSIDLEVKVK